MSKIWFYIVLWEFGAWKTQNTTSYIKKYNKNKEINITNYYTWYSHFQISSHRDIINILDDIYMYHQFVNLHKDRLKLYKLKPDYMLEEYEITSNEFFNKYDKNLKKWLKFNLVIDEAWIYFNARNFAKNFGWENEKLLDYIFQPRKLNLLFFCVVQSPMELDVKFRRLAWYYRKYYKWFWLYRWHKDYYFPNPDEMDFEKADLVWWWLLRWANFNFYPIFPRYDYNTKELLRPGTDIYTPWWIFSYIQNLSNTPKTNIITKIKKTLNKPLISAKS